MFPTLGNARILLCREAVDMRKSYDHFGRFGFRSSGRKPVVWIVVCFSEPREEPDESFVLGTRRILPLGKKLGKRLVPIAARRRKKATHRSGNTGNGAGRFESSQNEAVFPEI